MSTCRSVLEGCSRPKKYFPACIEINWNFLKRNLIFPPVSSSFDILHAHYVCESFFVRDFRWNSQWSRSVSLKMFKNTLPKNFIILLLWAMSGLDMEIIEWPGSLNTRLVGNTWLRKCKLPSALILVYHVIHAAFKVIIASP